MSFNIWLKDHGQILAKSELSVMPKNAFSDNEPNLSHCVSHII